ncbi:hypothetical protein L2U69_00995 [Zavarzinia compransoris]|uniref:hypothetical protein n=1 Tax=Zavarzinia marina TaxID=2911065 RepID=UPI001F439090|nr:hypothetical protein [Zavarzinia marina]MCF4164219.1 hypothetical protein [Zavarzinia marina]
MFKSLATLLASALVLAACASGTDFARPSAANVTVGVSTEQDVIARFGAPGRRQGGIAPKPTPEQIAKVTSPFDPMPVEGSFARLDYD